MRRVLCMRMLLHFAAHPHACVAVGAHAWGLHSEIGNVPRTKQANIPLASFCYDPILLCLCITWP